MGPVRLGIVAFLAILAAVSGCTTGDENKPADEATRGRHRAPPPKGSGETTGASTIVYDDYQPNWDNERATAPAAPEPEVEKEEIDYGRLLHGQLASIGSCIPQDELAQYAPRASLHVNVTITDSGIVTRSSVSGARSEAVTNCIEHRAEAASFPDLPDGETRDISTTVEFDVTPPKPRNPPARPAAATATPMGSGATGYGSPTPPQETAARPPGYVPPSFALPARTP